MNAIHWSTHKPLGVGVGVTPQCYQPSGTARPAGQLNGCSPVPPLLHPPPVWSVCWLSPQAVGVQMPGLRIKVRLAQRGRMTGLLLPAPPQSIRRRRRRRRHVWSMRSRHTPPAPAPPHHHTRASAHTHTTARPHPTGPAWPLDVSRRVRAGVLLQG